MQFYVTQSNYTYDHDFFIINKKWTKTEERK